MNGQERREAKAERLQARADRAAENSTKFFEQSEKATEGIPFGQPILVGHHSEKKHRAAVERACSAMEKSVKESEKSEYYSEKAESVLNSTTILMQDDDAVERLAEKLEKLGRLQTIMKEANKIIKSKKIAEVEKVDELVKIGMTEGQALEIMRPNCFGHVGFDSYQLTNNNAKIRDTKAKLERAMMLKSMQDETREVNGVEIEIAYSDNRIRLHFDGKPDEEVRSQLKMRGFRWAHSEMAWQTNYNAYKLRDIERYLQTL